MLQFDSTEFSILDKKNGDRERQQKTLDTETARQQTGIDTLNTNVLNPMGSTTMDNYKRSSDQAYGDYGGIMDRYKSYMDDPENFSFERVNGERIDPSTISYSRSPELASAMKGYQGFADNGGFDENAQRDIRARGISPIRAAYANTQMQMDRAKSIAGEGGGSNYIAALSRAQRELPQQLSDATQNVNADLADKIQRGKLAGLGGLSETSLADTNFGQQAQLANQDAIMRSRMSNQDVSLRAAVANQGAGMASKNNRLGAISGMTNLYGTAPGMASMFGNQALGAAQNQMGGTSMSNDVARQKIRGGLDIQQLPSKWSNVGKVAKIAGAAAATYFTGGAASPLLGMALKSGGPGRTSGGGIYSGGQYMGE